MTDLRTPIHERAPAAPSMELPSSTGLRLRPRRPARAVLAVLLVVASVVAALTIYVRIGDRQEVLAATRTVLAGEQLTAADFRVVSISTDDDLAVVGAQDREVLVGQYARVRIAAGSLVVVESVQPSPLVSAERVLMSITVPVGVVPIGLREGSRLTLVVTPDPNTAASAQPVLVEATVAAVPRDLADVVGAGSPTSDVALSVEVPPDRVALIGSAAAIAIGVLDPSAPFPGEQVTE
jgi:SAF domain